MRLAPAQLRRLVGQVNRRQSPARMRGEQGFELREHAGGIDIADHDEGQVIWDIAGLVIGHHVVARELVEQVEMTDNGMAVGVRAVGRGKKLLAVHAIRVVREHGKFAPDDLLFLNELVRRQGRIHAGVGEQLDGGGRPGARYVDPVDRPVE